jgi:hypothetical protein
MAAAVQVVVAAGLIGAWVWVLFRPLFRGFRHRFDGGVEGRDHQQRPPVAPADVSWLGWHRKPPTIRRRQLLLATLFATFASFLLAVALRGRFVYLFGLMLVVLVVHLGIASHLGGQIVEARQQARRTAVKSAGRQVARPGQMTIRASRVVVDRELTVEPYVSPLGEGAHAVASFVEELIELEWGSVGSAPDGPPPAQPGAESDTSPAAPGPEATEGPATEGPAAERPATEDPATDGLATDGPATDGPATEGPAAERPATEGPATEGPATDSPATDGQVEGLSEPDPIFTRPAAQVVSKPRRRPRPIYIHSHLDEGNIDPPKAVNHP